MRTTAATRRRLGKSDVFVTALGLGGGALGNLYEPVADETAEATVAKALELGVGYFDTAPFYGYGLAEERLGRGLARAGADRAAIVISSKVGRLLVPREGEARADDGFVGARLFDPVFDYSYEGVMRSFDASLERLRTDRIDVLLLHDVGARTHRERHRELFEGAMEGGLRAMRGLREQGAVGAIGLGVNETEVCIEALERAPLDALLLAGRYTLLEQGALDRLLPLCVERGTGVIVGGPFNSGVLVEAAGQPRHYDYHPPPPAILDRVARIGELCAAHGVPVPAVALQFPLHHPAVAAVIPGARTPAELEANAAWLGLDVPPSLYDDLRDAGLVAAAAPGGAWE